MGYQSIHSYHWIIFRYDTHLPLIENVYLFLPLSKGWMIIKNFPTVTDALIHWGINLCNMVFTIWLNQIQWNIYLILFPYLLHTNHQYIADNYRLMDKNKITHISDIPNLLFSDATIYIGFNGKCAICIPLIFHSCLLTLAQVLVFPCAWNVFLLTERLPNH